MGGSLSLRFQRHFSPERIMCLERPRHQCSQIASSAVYHDSRASGGVRNGKIPAFCVRV